jgi:hypothetical protein
MVLEQNMFIEQLLPTVVVRRLTSAEMDHYREPSQPSRAAGRCFDGRARSRSAENPPEARRSF